MTTVAPAVLAIGGIDPTGRTGIAADLTTLAAYRLRSTCVATGAYGPSEVYPLPTTVVSGQLSLALRDGMPAAVKIGMLATAEIAGALTARMRSDGLRNVVVDPELDAGYGFHRGVVAAVMRMLAYATVLTPNIDEASALVGWPIMTTTDMAGAAGQLAAAGAKCVVITGGRLGGSESVDAVWTNSGVRFLTGTRVSGPRTRGAGCTFATALAARLALGVELPEALDGAKEYVSRALAAARTHGLTQLGALDLPAIGPDHPIAADVRRSLSRAAVAAPSGPPPVGFRAGRPAAVLPNGPVSMETAVKRPEAGAAVAGRAAAVAARSMAAVPEQRSASPDRPVPITQESAA